MLGADIVGGVLEEKEFRESEVVLPTLPENAALIEFQPRRNSANRFYIDRNSISIGPDRVIRYSAVVKSPNGALTVSYEGMRCKTSEYKVYAFGVTRVSLAHYVVASFLGMLPGTLLYVWLGAVAGSLAAPGGSRARTPRHPVTCRR